MPTSLDRSSARSSFKPKASLIPAGLGDAFGFKVHVVQNLLPARLLRFERNLFGFCRLSRERVNVHTQIGGVT